MTARSTAFVALALVLAACGGAGTPTQAPGSASTPAVATATPAGTDASPAITAAPGESITAADIRAALDALQALDSWKFAGKNWTGFAGTGTEQSVQGTERRQPHSATDATHHSAAGDNRYIRIGDDIWVTLGSADTFFHYDAAESENLIRQYEPFHIAHLVANAAGSQVEYEPVAVETVNGVQAMHYTLSDLNRERLTELSGLDPAKWAGDVWIATDGGYLVKLNWGPQTVADAQPILGFSYDTTATNCDCPIEPPTNVATPDVAPEEAFTHMTIRSSAVLASVLVLVACGGSSPTQSPANSSRPAGVTPPPAGTPAPGQPIDSADVRNAMAALGSLDSYQFSGAYFTGYSGVGSTVQLDGTQRSTPTFAIDSTASTASGKTGQYIRIGNDIWVNSGDPDYFYQYDATDPANGALLAQYEPYAVAVHVADASGIQNTYQPVGVETVNGIESTHYALSQADRDALIQASGLDPEIWAGDVWLATNGGYLVSLRWGPQMSGETEPGEGFIWDTTATNCACPVNPPTNAPSP